MLTQDLSAMKRIFREAEKTSPGKMIEDPYEKKISLKRFNDEVLNLRSVETLRKIASEANLIPVVK